MFMTREEKCKVDTLLPDSYSCFISINRVYYNTGYPWMRSINLSCNHASLDGLIHDEVDLTGNRLKSRYRSHSDLSITRYSQNCRKVSLPIQCLRWDIECLSRGRMDSPKSDKYSIPFTILSRDSWMEKWEQARLMKWWHISDHLSQIGLDMSTK